MTSKESREIDAFSGSGTLYKDDERVSDVEYNLRVFQEFIDGSPGLKYVVGNISCDSTILFRLVASGDLHTLHFEGKKRLKLFISNSDGTVSPSGPIYEESETP